MSRPDLPDDESGWEKKGIREHIGTSEEHVDDLFVHGDYAVERDADGTYEAYVIVGGTPIKVNGGMTTFREAVEFLRGSLASKELVDDHECKEKGPVEPEHPKSDNMEKGRRPMSSMRAMMAEAHAMENWQDVVRQDELRKAEVMKSSIRPANSEMDGIRSKIPSSDTKTIKEDYPDFDEMDPDRPGRTWLDPVPEGRSNNPSDALKVYDKATTESEFPVGLKTKRYRPTEEEIEAAKTGNTYTSETGEVQDPKEVAREQIKILQDAGHIPAGGNPVIDTWVRDDPESLISHYVGRSPFHSTEMDTQGNIEADYLADLDPSDARYSFLHFYEPGRGNYPSEHFKNEEYRSRPFQHTIPSDKLAEADNLLKVAQGKDTPLRTPEARTLAIKMDYDRAAHRFLQPSPKKDPNAKEEPKIDQKAVEAKQIQDAADWWDSLGTAQQARIMARRGMDAVKLKKLDRTTRDKYLVSEYLRSQNVQNTSTDGGDLIYDPTSKTTWDTEPVSPTAWNALKKLYKLDGIDKYVKGITGTDMDGRMKRFIVTNLIGGKTPDEFKAMSAHEFNNRLNNIVGAFIGYLGQVSSNRAKKVDENTATHSGVPKVNGNPAYTVSAGGEIYASGKGKPLTLQNVANKLDQRRQPVPRDKDGNALYGYYQGQTIYDGDGNAVDTPQFPLVPGATNTAARLFKTRGDGTSLADNDALRMFGVKSAADLTGDELKQLVASNFKRRDATTGESVFPVDITEVPLLAGIFTSKYMDREKPEGSEDSEDIEIRGPILNEDGSINPKALAYLQTDQAFRNPKFYTEFYSNNQNESNRSAGNRQAYMEPPVIEAPGTGSGKKIKGKTAGKGNVSPETPSSVYKITDSGPNTGKKIKRKVAGKDVVNRGADGAAMMQKKIDALYNDLMGMDATEEEVNRAAEELKAKGEPVDLDAIRTQLIEDKQRDFAGGRARNSLSRFLNREMTIRQQDAAERQGILPDLFSYNDEDSARSMLRWLVDHASESLKGDAKNSGFKDVSETPDIDQKKLTGGIDKTSESEKAKREELYGKGPSDDADIELDFNDETNSTNRRNVHDFTDILSNQLIPEERMGDIKTGTMVQLAQVLEGLGLEPSKENMTMLVNLINPENKLLDEIYRPEKVMDGIKTSTGKDYRLKSSKTPNKRIQMLTQPVNLETRDQTGYEDYKKDRENKQNPKPATSKKRKIRKSENMSENQHLGGMSFSELLKARMDEAHADDGQRGFCVNGPQGWRVVNLHPDGTEPTWPVVVKDAETGKNFVTAKNNAYND